MRRELLDGPHIFEITAARQVGDAPEGEVRLSEPRTAAQFVERFRRHQGNAPTLRGLLGAEGPPPSAPLTDDQVFAAVATGLAARRFRLYLRRSDFGTAWDGVTERMAPSETRPAPRERSGPGPAPQEPGTFGPNADDAAIAATLRAAAEDGTPFCEECEKARQAEGAGAAA